MTTGRGSESILDRAVRLLEAFSRDRPRLTVPALAAAADLPVATTYRISAQLVRLGLLARDADGRLLLSTRFWEIANRSSGVTGLREAAAPYLDIVQQVVRQHTQIGVLEGDEVLILERLSSIGSVANRATEAGRLPARRTALGLSLLAYAPDAVRAAAVALAVEEGTDAQLRRDLAHVRREGFAVQEGRLDVDTTGIAVPVLNGSGRAVAALGIVVPRGYAQVGQAVAALRTAARGIALAVGDASWSADGSSPTQ